jgi:multidrug efflux pump subunit AcrA (membrane-fusion protein)
VALTAITIGQDYGSAVEVLSGLTPNDAVIVNPSDSLADGAAVSVHAPSGGTMRP